MNIACMLVAWTEVCFTAACVLLVKYQREVLLCRFVEHMQRTHPMFAGVFYGVFATEAEAEAYATYGDKRLWALVTFHEVRPCIFGELALSIPHEYSQPAIENGLSCGLQSIGERQWQCSPLERRQHAPTDWLRSIL